jgi:C_GCAxxG_C_C family probable redox protein
VIDLLLYAYIIILRGVFMGDKAEYAVKLFKEGYNCSQAVLCAFCEELGMDNDTALRLAASFGGGMGRLREVCGAVTGMFMIAGLKYGYTDVEDRQLKQEHYELIQMLSNKFKEINGSIICRELLGLEIRHDTPVPEERTETYYKKRPCAELVKCAAGIIEEVILEKEAVTAKDVSSDNL